MINGYKSNLIILKAMIILSIDVGIRNLSYVIIKLEKNNEDTKIPKFEIIDWKNENILKNYSDLNYIRSDLKRMTLNELKEVCNFHELITHGKLKKDYVESINNFLKINKVSKAKYTPSLETIGNGLISKLDNIVNFVIENHIDFDHIILENQPKVNFQMCTLQIMIFTYFLLNFRKNMMLDRDTKLPHLECVSPSLKSKFCDSYMTLDSCLDSYKERKKTSIRLVESILSDSDLKRFKCWTGKKDDLADVIIQSFGYYSKITK